jgi:hypothetical protein
MISEGNFDGDNPPDTSCLAIKNWILNGITMKIQARVLSTPAKSSPTPRNISIERLVADKVGNDSI